ncbi:MAG: DnaJ domain-containing protein [Terrisporobacter sp.]|uniref:DnaJ domain-containing protein n=1 Tax=Terrisporobacter sp. TaxID=1965305 RepID=UPI002FCA0E48
MPVLEELVIKGYIDTRCDEKHSGLQKVSCPFCNSEYNLEDGIYNCTFCNKSFRKIGLATYDAQKVTNAAADCLIQLLTFCAKADGKISSSERDYIIEYILSFDINDDQESWAFAQYDYARYKDYNKESIILLKESISQLVDKYNLELEVLYEMFNLLLIDTTEFNDNQIDIIEDFISVFQIPSKLCEKIMNEVLNDKKNNHESEKQEKKHINDPNNLDKYYEILGLKKGCSEMEIKKKYASLTKSFHPDKYNSEEMPLEVKKELEDMYKKINLAYDKLRGNI